MIYRIKVDVNQLVPFEALDQDDQDENPAGPNYEYHTLADSADDACEKALDHFHLTVPIACVDDFEVTASHIGCNCLLCRICDAFPGFEDDDEVSGADLVDFINQSILR